MAFPAWPRAPGRARCADVAFPRRLRRLDLAPGSALDAGEPAISGLTAELHLGDVAWGESNTTHGDLLLVMTNIAMDHEPYKSFIKMVIFHGYVSHNQMISHQNPSKSGNIHENPWDNP